jgi:hypothetical protein
VTGDLELARQTLAESDFFGAVFDIDPSEQQDLVGLHTRAARILVAELRARADS